jgi:orotidine-5'-phosphate decarboxylase
MIIVAIDEITFNKASSIIDNLDSTKCMVKIGSVAFNSIGHKVIDYAAEKGFDIFLDLKLHDIPNTVKKSIKGLTNLPITMITVHTSGGKDMMVAAMEAVSGTDIKVFGVTTLTSLNDDDTNKIYQRNASDHVNAMLDLAESAAIDGVVCSPHELDLVSKRESLLSITPGIRLQDLNDDQSRVMSPEEAINLGANYLVIGRPITQSDNILGTLEDIFNKITNS